MLTQYGEDETYTQLKNQRVRVRRKSHSKEDI